MEVDRSEMSDNENKLGGGFSQKMKFISFYRTSFEQ